VLSTDGYAVSRIAISPDGHLIAGAIADRSVRIWDEAGNARKLQGHKDLVMDVAFSPDGGALASASYDRTVRIWQLKTGRHRVLRGHSGPVNRVVWRNAHELVSGSQDGTLRVWQVPSMELPTAQQVAARLDAATTAQIDDHDPQHRATTL
jgi:WD40 repeat protein